MDAFTSARIDRQITKHVKGEYLVYFPDEYQRDNRKWPLLLFLHGAGERGEDVKLVKTHGPLKLVEKGKQFPFVIVAPQCPKDQWWPLDLLTAVLDEVMQKYRIDEDRVYVTGLSMGGFGTWALALKFPNRFAAIAPICGGGQPLIAERIKHLPVWVFHGAEDPVVPLEKSREMVAALERVGGKVSFTIYPDAQHDSWTKTYENPVLYDWLLRQKRTPTSDR